MGEMKKNILIIGSGAREHAIGWKLGQSKLVGQIFFAPGNGGTQAVGQNVDIGVDDVKKLVQFAKTNAIDLTVVGPEAALAAGIVDAFTGQGLRAFGPTKKAARLETSKAWATEFLKRHNFPIPRSVVFKDPQKARVYAVSLGGSCVVKADGLCQGKGVFVCENKTQTDEAINALMVRAMFGSAGKRIIIQEKLIGPEISVMAFCDGTRAIPLVVAQDYKRAFDGDKGPNTGGMGAVAPANRVGAQMFSRIQTMLSGVVAAMKTEGMPYHGILYAGILVSQGKPYILEFNCRFGDPETQVQLPLLDGDFYSILDACVEGSLVSSMVFWKRQIAVGVVLASRGYPGSYTTGHEISIASDDHNDVSVFHAGTAISDERLLTHGGRVLTVVAVAGDTESARKKAYARIKNGIAFEGMQYRRDIGY